MDFFCCGTGGAKRQLAFEAMARDTESQTYMPRGMPQMGHHLRTEHSHHHPDLDKPARHHCTDPAWAVIWLACLALAGYILHEAHAEADIRLLYHGIDWDGNVCGLGDYEYAPYLYWCPAGGAVMTKQQLFEAQINPTVTGGDAGQTTEVQVHAKTDWLMLERPICVQSCPTDTSTFHMCVTSVTSSNRTIDAGTGSFTKQKDFIIQGVQDVPTSLMGQTYCMPKDGHMEEELHGKFSWGLQSLMYHLGQADEHKDTILAAIGIAMVIGYSYLLLSSCFARIVVYLSIALGSLMPIVAGIYLLQGEVISSHAHQLMKQQGYAPVRLQTFTTGRDDWDLGISAGLVLLGIAVAGLACWKRDRIEMVLATVKVVTKCMYDTPALLFHPLWMVVPRVLSVAAAFAGLALLLTTGEVKHGETLHMTQAKGIARSFHFDELQKLQLGFYCFVSLWTIEVLRAIDEFVFAHVASVWYWKKGKGEQKEQKAMDINVTFSGYMLALQHIGSLAYGSLVLMLFRPITFVLSFFHSHEGVSTGDSCMATCLAGGYCCGAQCWERFLCFLTRDAYLMVAVNSVGFIEGAEQAVEVHRSEGKAAAAVRGARKLFQLGGLVSITLGSVVLTWMMFSWHQALKGEARPDDFVSSAVFVTIIGGVFSLLVATIFTNMFDIIANTFLFTWTCDHSKDYDHNHGLPQKLENLLRQASKEDHMNGQAYLRQSTSFGFGHRQGSHMLPPQHSMLMPQHSMLMKMER